MKKILLLFAIFTTFIINAQHLSTDKSGGQKIAFGPYIQKMGTKDVTICWSTIASEPTLTDKNGKVSTIREYKQHKVLMGNLEPNTKYSYDILNDGSDEGKGTFKTYQDNVAPFNFVVLGDTRSRHDIHANIVGQIIKKDPSFVVNTGDLVGNGRSIGDWESFFSVNKELMRNTPYYTVLGNHEKDSPYYYDFFELPNNERYYYFTLGDALFIVLDGEGEHLDDPAYLTDRHYDQYWVDLNKGYLTTQKNWLEKVLEINKEAGFIFVFMHKPLYGVKKSRLEEVKQTREFWGDIFDRHGVQVFMNGHDHHYHHAMKNNVHYITTAGGGAGLYEVDSPQPETVKYNKIEHYVNVEVNTSDAVLHVIDINGKEIDNIKVVRRKTK